MSAMGATDLRADLVIYLQATGWSEVSTGPAGGLWGKPGLDWRIPVPTKVSNADFKWRDIVERVAIAEGRERGQVERQIKLAQVDVTNVRAAYDIIIADTIPYEAGAAMISDSWKMFRSCATTAERPRAYLRGQYRITADEIIRSARMAHTRPGSYVIPIYLPLTLMEDNAGEDSALFNSAPPEPPERRVTRTFAEALSTFEQVVVQPESEPKQGALAEMVEAGVSSEFAAAVARVLSLKSVAEFSTDFEWAAAGGPPPAVRERVAIQASAAPRAEAAARALRHHSRPRRVEILTGPLVGAHRDDVGGWVEVQTVRNAQQAKVRVNVSEGRLDEALGWMRRRETVVVQGRVRRISGGLICDERNGVHLLATTQLPSE